MITEALSVYLEFSGDSNHTFEEFLAARRKMTARRALANQPFASVEVAIGIGDRVTAVSTRKSHRTHEDAL